MIIYSFDLLTASLMLLRFGHSFTKSAFFKYIKMIRQDIRRGTNLSNGSPGSVLKKCKFFINTLELPEKSEVPKV